jgi:hypothetical protein
VRILKVKRKKPTGLIVEFERKNPEGKTNKFSMDCVEKPDPCLLGAMDNLADSVRDMCELPDDGTTITVKGVSFSYGGEREVMGAVIIAQRSLKNANSPMNLLTPHKASEPYNEGGHIDPKAILDDEVVDWLNVLRDRVVEYIDGRREQTDLFDQGKEDSGES